MERLRLLQRLLEDAAWQLKTAMLVSEQDAEFYIQRLAWATFEDTELRIKGILGERL